MADNINQMIHAERKRYRVSLLHVEPKSSVKLPEINTWTRSVSDRMKNKKKRQKRQVKEDTVFSKMEKVVKSRDQSQKPQTKDRRLSCMRTSTMRLYPHPSQDTVLYFDPTSLGASHRLPGISDGAKKLFEKPPASRDPDDLRFLCDVLLRLPVFSKYPVSVLKELASLLRYMKYEDGQTVLQQGRSPNRLIYFLLSGEVDLVTNGVLKADQERHQKIVAGPTCGELALNIRDSSEAITAVCKGTSEFLTLKMFDFDRTLRSTWETQFKKRFQFLRSCEFFKTWTDKQLYGCADLSSFRNFDDQEVILGNTDTEPSYLYFLCSGTCDIVRHMELERRQSPYMRPRLLLPQDLDSRERFLSKPYGSQHRLLREETHYLSVGILRPGDYFGIGENLLDTYILSRGRTLCILVCASFVRLWGKSAELLRARELRNFALPSKQSMYRSLKENIAWQEYRLRVLKEVMSGKGKRSQSKHIRYSDIPRSLREEPCIPEYLLLNNTADFYEI